MKKLKHGAMAIVFASVALAGMTQSPEAMAETVEVEIIEGPLGPVFKTPAIEIKAGDTVRWIVKDEREHHLKGDSPSDAFEETDDFGDTVKRTFKDPSGVKYHCTIHPETMQGTIAVK